jgi:dTDP-4-amino-4,6-dideoxygalactose transaminase
MTEMVMPKVVPRSGVQGRSELHDIVTNCRSRGELVRGGDIAEFEAAFAKDLGAEFPGIATSYGRMAFYYILKAYDLPPGSDVIVPALTFWAIPELVRVAGLNLVFADVDPATYNVSPVSLDRAITPRTRAIVPTHLYGLPCDMDAILEIAARRNFVVIEDCAHALGAHLRGRPAGMLGHAAFFSFHTDNPLATSGGGMALVHDVGIRDRVRALAAAERWPSEHDVRCRLRLAWHSLSASQPDISRREAIRPLHPLPASYTERYSNVQAAIGLAGLAHLDEWIESTRHHAKLLDCELAGQVRIPYVPPEHDHVYYRYSIPVPDHKDFVRRAIRQGIDVRMRHVNVCPRLPLFAASAVPVPGADEAVSAVQLPVHAFSSDDEVVRIGRIARDILERQHAMIAARRH